MTAGPATDDAQAGGNDAYPAGAAFDIEGNVRCIPNVGMHRASRVSAEQSTVPHLHWPTLGV
jgi:hypothetical protein